MKKLLVLIILCCLSATVAFAEQITSIHFASEGWEDYTNADGTGFYWDLFRAVYKPIGIKIEFEIVPYIRGTKMVQDKLVDSAVAYYLDDIDNALFPKWHFDQEVVVALFKKGKVTTWEGEKSLSGKLGWIRGYEFDQTLTMEHDFVEIDTRKSALKMLEFGHIDFFLDADVDIQAELEKGDVNPEEFQLETVFKENLYLTFADNERGRALMKIFDERMAELVASGELKPIFEEWGESYPFDE